MGKLELKSKRRAVRRNIGNVVLQTIEAAGILSAALLAPNVLGAMLKLGWRPHTRQNTVISRAKDRLVKRKLLKYVNGSLRLTEKGELVVERLRLSEFKRDRIDTWDGKWRVLVFDIPETKSGLRHKIRNTLRAIGFLRLQNSVWLYPYDCEDLVTLLKADMKIGSELLYMIVEELENDRGIRTKFGL